MSYPILKILIGIPASGKSTWAKEFVHKNDNWCIVSRDDFRYAWQNRGFCNPKIESLITEMVEKSIETLIARRVNVIYDATNVKHEYITDIARLVKHTARVEYEIFDIPLEVAIQRDSSRERRVGREVIERMYQNYVNLLDSNFDFSPINPVPKKYIAPKFDPSKKFAIIVDIDGTLAHTSGKRSPYEYDRVHVDDKDEIVHHVVNSIRGTGFNHDVLIVSGREDSCLTQTETWLSDHGVWYDKIFMRKTGDVRKDALIKEEIFWEHIEPQYNVIAVFDDRDQVVKMWRSLGLKCFQVDYGNF